MGIEKEREAFETWCHIDDQFCTHRYAGSEDYSDDYTQCAWLSWQAAKAQAVPKINGSIQEHELAISEIKAEIEEGYDLCQDSYLLDVLVERGIDIGKIQAVSEGFVLVSKEPTCEMIEAGMGNFDFPLDNGRFSNHDLIFAYRAMIEAQEQSHD